jgi:hypothetical protein
MSRVASEWHVAAAFGERGDRGGQAQASDKQARNKENSNASRSAISDCRTILDLFSGKKEIQDKRTTQISNRYLRVTQAGAACSRLALMELA